MKIIDRFNKEYHFLSNFYPVEIEYEGIIYPSVEHAYQAFKTMDKSIREEISKIKHPYDAKQRGKQLKLRSNWDIIKVDIMFDLLMRKFKQPTLNELLLQTGDAYLIDGNNWGDRFWGICNNEGKNVLGKLLMKVRNILTEWSNDGTI